MPASKRVLAHFKYFAQGLEPKICCSFLVPALYGELVVWAPLPHFTKRFTKSPVSIPKPWSESKNGSIDFDIKMPVELRRQVAPGKKGTEALQLKKYVESRTLCK